jgi:hypothetical protein
MIILLTVDPLWVLKKSTLSADNLISIGLEYFDELDFQNREVGDHICDDVQNYHENSEGDLFFSIENKISE